MTPVLAGTVPPSARKNTGHCPSDARVSSAIEHAVQYQTGGGRRGNSATFAAFIPCAP